VEQSRKDRFRGAVREEDDVLHGENRLGCLLMELREEVKAKGAFEMIRVAPPAIPDFCLLGEPIGIVGR
jgi:hypothetical protein